MAIAKVVLNGTTQMDTTQVTVTAADLEQGVTALGANGELITGTGGGEDVYYSTFNGAMYTEHFEYPTMAYGNNAPSILRSCANLKSIYLKNTSTSRLLTGSYIFAYNSALETVVIDSYWSGTNNNREFQNCIKLKEVQLGGIGHPVSAIQTNTFAGCTQSGLTITVYVADSTTIPLGSSPWGATNATIVYRSTTTGEVRTE